VSEDAERASLCQNANQKQNETSPAGNKCMKSIHHMLTFSGLVKLVAGWTDDSNSDGEMPIVV
jgi:hypothetical protein